MSVFRKNKYITLGILSFCSSLLIGCQGINSYQAVYYLSQANEILGDTGRELEVIDLANKALEIEENADAYYYLGFAKSDIGKNKEAINDLNKAIELNSSDARYFYVRGNTKDSLRDYEGAIKDFKKTVELDPTHINALGNLANAQKDIGQYQEAIASLDTAITIDPRHSNNLRMRGNIKYEIKDYKAAIKDFDKALDIPSKVADEKAWTDGVHGRVYYDRGWAKYAIEDINGACEDWSNGAKMRNSDANDAFNRYCTDSQSEEEVQEFSDAEVNELFELAGGSEKYNEMMKWAINNLSKSETEEFDQTIEKGIFDEAKQAIIEIKEKYDSREE